MNSDVWAWLRWDWRQVLWKPEQVKGGAHDCREVLASREAVSQVLCAHVQHLVETSLARPGEEPLPRVKAGETGQSRSAVLCVCAKVRRAGQGNM